MLSDGVNRSVYFRHGLKSARGPLWTEVGLLSTFEHHDCLVFSIETEKPQFQPVMVPLDEIETGHLALKDRLEIDRHPVNKFPE